MKYSIAKLESSNINTNIRKLHLASITENKKGDSDQREDYYGYPHRAAADGDLREVRDGGHHADHRGGDRGVGQWDGERCWVYEVGVS